MEHRCTQRYSGDLQILIYKHNVPIAIGRLKNGSKFGGFVETDFADIECEHQLHIEVLAQKQLGSKQSLHMEAIVIHKTNHGFGVELDMEDREQADTFIEMLRGTQQFRPQAPKTDLANVANG
jgi:hypothetical protein